MESYKSITQKDFDAAPVNTILNLKATNGVKASAIKHSNGKVLELGRANARRRCIFPSLKVWKKSFESVDYVIFRIVRAETRGLPRRLTPITPPTEDVKLLCDVQDTLRDKATILHMEGRQNISPEVRLEETVKLLNSSKLSNTDRCIIMKYYTLEQQTYEGMMKFWNEHFPNTKYYIKAVPPKPSLYVFNAIANKFEPIYYMKVADATTPSLGKADKLMNYRAIEGQDRRLRYLLAHLLEIPTNEFIYFRNSYGTSFVDAGVPLGSDGKPEFWYMNSSQEFVKM
jgi:hypothetical protein